MSAHPAPAATAPRVLIVDDNPLNIEMATLVLAGDGLLVDSVDSAEAALQRLAAPPRPDLVLMDIQLPRIDGLQLTQRLRADPATAGLLIVAFTAYAMKGDRERLLAAGCDGYIAKPIDIPTFAARIRAYLAGQRD